MLIPIYLKFREFSYRLDMFFSPDKMNRFCPCCGLKFRAFVSGKYSDLPDKVNTLRYAKTRQDVLCPFCGSLPRHRILVAWFEERRQYLRASDFLLFAPENSILLWMRRNDISSITADLYNSADLQLDIQATGLCDEIYDVIICNHVLEHVDDFRIALKEVFRILRKDGIFICSFPMDSNLELLEEEKEPLSKEERIQRFGQYDHKRLFGLKADRFLSEMGFKVEPIRGEDYPDLILPIVGPADYDINLLFCCRKG